MRYPCLDADKPTAHRRARCHQGGGLMWHESVLQAPEGKQLEFKRDLSSLRGVLKTLIAFANSAGGLLVVGVSDEREAVGVGDPFAQQERLASLIADNIAPRLVPEIEMTTVQGKTLLLVEVFPSSRRPHHFRKEGPQTEVYVRLGSTNRQADAPLIAELERSAAGQGGWCTSSL